MKRNIRLVAAGLVAVLAMAGCSMNSGSEDDSSSDSTTSASEGSDAGTGSAEDLKVGLVAVNLNSPSIAAIKDSFVAAAEAKGWSVDVFDGQGDQNATNNAASDFIQRGYDVIVNNSSPNQQMTGVIEQAHAKGIPFVSIYGGFVEGVDAEIGTNEFVNASLITQEMVNRLGGKGKVLKLNWTVLQALRDRDAGFHAVVGENPGIDVVREIEVKVPGQVDDSYAQVTNALQSDKDIDAIWIGWDELAPPVVRAVKEAGLGDKIFVVGFDGNAFAWDLIRDGSPYVMEPANPFPPMGEKAVDAIETLATGGELPSHVIYMKPCLINAQTVPPKGEEPDWENCAYFPGEI
ncbi:MAG: sugar ABC transporter substrate-binding protein [Nocardioides sp.]|nr:sugar ABC transporter substrate-binding protein [Nocardioides sp.]